MKKSFTLKVTTPSVDLVESYPAEAFNHPHLFVTDKDAKRTSNTAYAQTVALLDGAQDVEIKPDNTFSIAFKDGAYYGSPKRIGVDIDTAAVLSALLDSGLPITVLRAGSNPITLVETEEAVETEEETVVAD